MIPAAILRAFSIELALKSLLYAESASRGHGHDLQKLFQKLTPDSQAKIAAAAQATLKRPFADVLAEIKTIFEDWRYIHEKFASGASLGFDTDELKAVAHAVLQVLDAKFRAVP